MRVAIITKRNFQHCANAYKSWHTAFAVYHPSKMHETTQIASQLFYLCHLVQFGAVCCH